mmetsp:Transcript_62/g.103  ORF Transcript_62/g.103 Transcript_62/m.103 type:complete len:207 (-) Transcript_62:83-703(-)
MPSRICSAAGGALGARRGRGAHVDGVRHKQLLLLLVPQRRARNGGERRLHVDVVLGARLKVGDAALGGRPRLGLLLGHHARVTPVHVNLVAQHHEREVVWVLRPSLYQELVAPVVQVVESLGIVHVIHQDAAVSSTVECYAKGLEAFLASRVPDLHGHRLVVNFDLLCQEVSTDGRLVLFGKFLLHILIHQARLSNTAVPQNDDLQ